MKRKRKGFKINGDTMTTIVVSSLVLCVGFVLTGFYFAWNDKDVTGLVECALRVFGTELGICGVMTIFKRWGEAMDRRAEESRRRAEERRQERMNRNG